MSAPLLSFGVWRFSLSFWTMHLLLRFWQAIWPHATTKSEPRIDASFLTQTLISFGYVDKLSAHNTLIVVTEKKTWNAVVLLRILKSRPAQVLVVAVTRMVYKILKQALIMRSSSSNKAPQLNAKTCALLWCYILVKQISLSAGVAILPHSLRTSRKLRQWRCRLDVGSLGCFTEFWKEYKNFCASCRSDIFRPSGWATWVRNTFKSFQPQMNRK